MNGYICLPAFWFGVFSTVFILENLIIISAIITVLRPKKK